MKTIDDTTAPSRMEVDTAEHKPPFSAVQGRVLLIAYHFPPDAASTGRLRTLGFMRHLPAFGWQPSVLTAHKRAYERVDDTGFVDIPDGHPVCRAFALDTRQHLGWHGKYLSMFATPDRWVTWWPDAVRVGLRMIRAHRIDAIWSTFPIMTSHLVGMSLSRLTGLPWVADFRDPVVSNGIGFNQRACRWLEHRVVTRAARSVFTTPGAKRLYADRFRELVDETKFVVISNGYEEEKFRDLVCRERERTTPCTLVHSGLLYRDGRNPLEFFRALAELKTKGAIHEGKLRIVLRASGHEEEYAAERDRLGLGNLVELAPPVSYKVALQEQAAADGLLLFQGSIYNRQIPAKVYEYLRVGRPILALTDPEGDTAKLLASEGIDSVASLDDAAGIATVLQAFLKRIKNRTIVMPTSERVARYSRVAGARRLAALLDQVVRG